jgi:alkylation response protein AidB-like acyl-CoA dehydrogenase
MTAIERDCTTEAIVERARSLAPTISERALEGEQARRVPDDVVGQMREGGLLRLFVPKALGGLEVDPFTMIEVIETIARADGSTGWVAMILNGSFMTAWVEPTAAQQMAASVDGDVVLSGNFGPMGRATADADGFRVIGGTLIMDGSNPVMRPDGRPDLRFMMFPMSDTVVHDTWRAAGLKATASHDLSVDDVHVPEALTPAPMFDVPRHDGPLWRFSFFGLLGCCMVGVPLGIARRALDEAVPLSQTKSRNGGRSTMAEDGAVQLDLIKAETALRAARSLALEAIGTAWEHALAGNPMSTDDRLAVRLATFHAAEVGLRVVDTCFRIGGGGALYEHSPLQRCWRDLHAASHHLFFGDQSLQDIARVHLGLEADALTM